MPAAYERGTPVVDGHLLPVSQGSLAHWQNLTPLPGSSRLTTGIHSGDRETGILLPNNQRQHRTSHAPKDMLPLRKCANVGHTTCEVHFVTYVDVGGCRLSRSAGRLET